MVPVADKGLRKDQMVRGQRAFNRIFEEGMRVGSRHVVLLTSEGEGRKFGFAVSRKIRGAVRRNRARRLLREAARLNQDEFPDNQHVILLAKAGTEELKCQEVCQEVLTLVERLKDRKLER